MQLLQVVSVRSFRQAFDLIFYHRSVEMVDEFIRFQCQCCGIWRSFVDDRVTGADRATTLRAAIGGVPGLVVPDNAKVAVIKACLYEPKVNLEGHISNGCGRDCQTLGNV